MMAEHSVIRLPTLAILLEDIVDVKPSVDMPVAAVRLDSRLVELSDLFIAHEGTQTSGTRFIHDAIAKGASAILVDAKSGIAEASVPIPVYSVSNLSAKTGLIASRFYDNPSKDLYVSGITGTNGKTSIAYYLAQALSESGTQPVGSIGTLGYGVFPDLQASANTTPDAITIQRLLSEFRSRRIRDVVMEVSSHALEQGRANNILFHTAVFSNLSRDHLDYHGDMSRYAGAKRKLLLSDGLANAVINFDDEFGQQLIKDLTGQLNVISYGLADSVRRTNAPRPFIEAVIKKQEFNSLLMGINSPWGSGELQARLTGRFNAYNLLAALGVLYLRGMTFDSAVHKLSSVQAVPGRMEFFGRPDTARIFVDYSHTPDALQQALKSLREQCSGRLLCVFGCGGDRDQGKRPEMGRIAETGADHVILTSDNPRSEKPEKIIEDILDGMTGSTSIEIQPDRALAIRAAITGSGKEDIVLIAGKGHETYQEIMATKLPFSDRQLVRSLLEQSR